MSRRNILDGMKTKKKTKRKKAFKLLRVLEFL